MGIFYSALFLAKLWKYWESNRYSAGCQEILSKGKNGEALELIDVKSHSIAKAIRLSPALLRGGRTTLSSFRHLFPLCIYLLKCFCGFSLVGCCP